MFTELHEIMGELNYRKNLEKSPSLWKSHNTLLNKPRVKGKKKSKVN